eukprot:TRINITY_DN4291_c0_g1_i1.p3 TRINITY_DN4291_c0_g1~~TRINITY_DN4291_c0_g1_i1.p3  ORF type:complete len:108 (+),score=19.30 TRINITY_DN4291_c0_g1_i1:345-668(+)
MLGNNSQIKNQFQSKQVTELIECNNQTQITNDLTQSKLNHLKTKKKQFCQEYFMKDPIKQTMSNNQDKTITQPSPIVNTKYPYLGQKKGQVKNKNMLSQEFANIVEN